MSIAAAVLDAIRGETSLHGGGRPTRAGLRIGELSGVEPESLRFCLETLVADTDLDRLAFEIEIRPWTRRCRGCGAEFRVVDYRPDCPTCFSGDTEALAGEELELGFIELEDSDARAPGT
jgi:hydrogenase nickel incorporation protein HypA/HybF